MLACVISFFLCFSLLARLFISSFMGYFCLTVVCLFRIKSKGHSPAFCFLLVHAFRFGGKRRMKFHLDECDVK